MDQASFNQKYVQFCVPFVKGLQKIYSTMLRCELHPLKPEIKNSGVMRGDYSAVMGMNGHYRMGIPSAPFVVRS